MAVDKFPAPLIVFNRYVALVNLVVVVPTQHDEVVDVGISARTPMLDVMNV